MKCAQPRKISDDRAKAAERAERDAGARRASERSRVRADAEAFPHVRPRGVLQRRDYRSREEKRDEREKIFFSA